MQGQTHLPDKSLRPKTDRGRDRRSKVPDVAVGQGRPLEMECVGVAQAEEEGEQRQADRHETEATDRDGEEDDPAAAARQAGWRWQKRGSAEPEKNPGSKISCVFSRK